MTEDDLARFIAERFDHVDVVVASQDNGAPEVAWGDRFFHYGADRLMPFATIVTKDYDGFDTVSDLNRPGVFRLNIGVSRSTFQSLFPDAPGPAPATHDYTELDRLLPHPTYAGQGWVCILNPTEASLPRLEPLLAEAHARAATRDSRRGQQG